MRNIRLNTFIACMVMVLGIALGHVADHWLTSPMAAANSSPIVLQGDGAPLTENSVIQVADSLKDSVVSVVATKEIDVVVGNPYYNNPFFDDPFFRQFMDIPQEQQQQQTQQQPEVKKEKTQVSAGTGFVVTEDGLVLTNKHVVEDTDAEYTVIFNGETKYPAEVVTRDPANDLAILRIKSTKTRTYHPVSFIPDADSVRVGQFVVAIGNALGEYDNSVTMGVVSAKDRTITTDTGNGETEKLNNLIQTDAAINPGNSGGPLVSLSGQVLGINTAIAGGAQGIGFALPLDQNTIDEILGQIRTNGKILRPYLGVNYIPLTADINKQMNAGQNEGAWIKTDNGQSAIVSGSPAEKAGLKEGDIILRVNGQLINDKNQLSDAIDRFKIGDALDLSVWRNQKTIAIKVILGERPDETAK